MKRCWRFFFSLLAVAACLLTAAGSSFSASVPSNDVAIVVNPDVPINDLSLADVRKIFMGDRQYWTPNLRITLLIRAPIAHERDVVLKTIYHMTEAEFRQYWIGKIFRAEAVSGPKIVYSNEMAIDLVASIPGCIAFVDASKVPPNVKVVKTNGLLPGEPGYPLH